MSYYLSKQDRNHIILEQSDKVGESWRNKRDSFTLVTPNWMNRLPGFPYAGDDPDGFITRDEVVSYLEDYVELFNPPIEFNFLVTSIEKKKDYGYLVRGRELEVEAKIVIVCTGAFHVPKIPAISNGVPAHILKLHTSQYKNPESIPDGSILVVGSGQSGCQIAEELNESGRQVYLSISSCGRLPRRYRGKDGVWWMNELGMFDVTTDRLESPRMKFACNPHLSGRGGGHEINLHHLNRDGVILLGYLDAASKGKMRFMPNLAEKLEDVDRFANNFKKQVDIHIRKHQLSFPEENGTGSISNLQKKEITNLDLEEAGIKTIIWGTGYTPDFSWIHLPVFDEKGHPIQKRGVTSSTGLYFLGLNWLNKLKSGLLFGVGDDASFIASVI